MRFTKMLAKGALGVLGLLVALLVVSRGVASFREVDRFGTLPPQGGQIVQTEKGGIYTLERGPKDGSVLLFAHGTAAWSGLWLPTLEAMGRLGYRAIAFDMPPFGYSEHPLNISYTRQERADIALALVQALGVRPIVVAHSIGAGPMAEAVLTAPQAFAGFVIVDGAIGVDGHLAPSRMPAVLRPLAVRDLVVAATVSNPLLTQTFTRQFVHIKEAVTPDIVALLQQPLQRHGYTGAVTAWLPQLFDTPTDAVSTQPEAWQALRVPTHILWGERDDVTPLSQAQTLAALIPGAGLSVMAGVGHIPQLEAPDLFQANLAAALQQIGAQP
jgi:pimeloyl-ACP methyl ester carboxylesterase